MARRPIPAKDRKLSSEYPQFAFRISKKKKDALTTEVEAIQATRNRRRKESEPFINKNDVIIEALELGLKAMKKLE